MTHLKYTIIGSLALSILGSSAFAQTTPTFTTGGQRIFSTGAGVPCDNQLRTLTWIAPRNLLLSEIQIWNGLQSGTIADVPEIITRASDNAVIIDGGHDDYQNSGPVRIQKESWGGHPFQLNVGDVLQFRFFCSDAGSQIGGWVVTIFTMD